MLARRTHRLSHHANLSIPSPGFGTWHYGEEPSRRDEELAALRHAIELGFRHFDTAEMYAEGESEKLLGAACHASEVAREELFIVSKVYPWNAGRQAMQRACEQSLDRLDMDYLDLYLLHWPGGVPFEETLEAAHALLHSGKIRAFGISNFDTAQLSSLIQRGLADIVDVNQVMHNLPHRGPEVDLFPLMQRHDILPVAYSPLELGPTSKIDAISSLATELELTLAELVLAWHLNLGEAVPIPKSSTISHIDALAEAAKITLSEEVMARIHEAAPVPDRPVSLEVR